MAKGWHNGMARCVQPDMAKHMHLFMLWLLSKKGMHGYEMLKMLRADRSLQQSHKISASSLYPALNDMLSMGLILQHKAKSGKRVRKVYLPSAKGRRMLQEGKKMFKGLIGQFAKEMVS
jgi:DNA-binding PadR family transcriptional regulator